MKTRTRCTHSIRSGALLLCLSLLVHPLAAQEQKQQPPAQTQDDVVRISTELIQTDVMVFDRQGKFVDGLRPEQFELRVDGQPQAVSFFERIMAGSRDEDAQIAAARGGSRAAPQSDQSVVRPLDRGRAIFFYLDDLHMAADSLNRTRAMLAQFIEREMGQNDVAGLYTASGQLGILQQLTGEKVVLQTALKRLQPIPYNVRDIERIAMSESQALAIERNDRSTLDYFIEQLARDQGMQSLQASRSPQRIGTFNPTDNQFETAVRSRARSIIEQAALITRNTLTGLENLVRASSPISGRKLLFFISDGFYTDERSSNTNNNLSRITDAAARSGTVIYSIEARGLVTGLTPANERIGSGASARLAPVDLGATVATQQPLHKLASDTGGRALLNSNTPDAGLVQALKETSAYYLLAWRPASMEQRGGKFHQIEVSVKGRDDLTVRVRSGFLSEQPEPESKPKPKPSKSKSDKLTPEETDLIAAINSFYPKRALPTTLATGYVNAPNTELKLAASVQVDASGLSVNPKGDGQQTKVDIIGVLINDQGKPISNFAQRLTIDPSVMTPAQQRRIVYSHLFPITPGLYQIRVATRADKSGRTGSATQWIEVPDVARGFSLGSLFLGEMQASNGSTDTTTPQVHVNVDRRFSRNSRLIYQTIVYNAARGVTQPDIAVQVQVFRDDQPVVTVPLRKILTDKVTDIAHIPFDDDVPLAQLPPGRYVLRVTAIDRVAKASASQRLNFEIE
jgi:VWFA-related protein